MILPEVKFVRQLLEKALNKIGESTDGAGFEKLAKQIPPHKGHRIKMKYLRENLWYEVLKSEAAQIEHRKFSIANLNRIALFLDYADFSDFKRSITQPLPPDLQKCLGHWWSYVRANAGEFVLKAPIRIAEKKETGSVTITMKGEQNTYTGTANLHNGNLFCLIHSPNGKSFYSIFKVGVNTDVRVLQGIFAGISGAGEPIGGRELFVKADEKMWEGMKWQKLPLEAEVIGSEIYHYFKSQEKNCLKIDKVSRFNMDDLML